VCSAKTERRGGVRRVRNVLGFGGVGHRAILFRRERRPTSNRRMLRSADRQPGMVQAEFGPGGRRLSRPRPRLRPGRREPRRARASGPNGMANGLHSRAK
jgi:hypothetical protein